MSFSDLDNLRTKNEFEEFIANAQTFQQSNEFINEQEASETTKSNAIKEHICKVIMNHFNNENQNNVNPNNADLTIFIGHLSQDDKNSLISLLEQKGYVCVFDEITKRLTISISQN